MPFYLFFTVGNAKHILNGLFNIQLKGINKSKAVFTVPYKLENNWIWVVVVLVMMLHNGDFRKCAVSVLHLYLSGARTPCLDNGSD